DIVQDEQRTQMRAPLEDSRLQVDERGVLRGIKPVETGQAVVEALRERFVDRELAGAVHAGEGFKGERQHAVLVMPADALGHSACRSCLADAPKPVQQNKALRMRR